ncbi:NAD(P)-binding protein [Faecalibacter bovis]|uniref:NAD(P)-binding protein n=1 Tax=Faecalibacter bovis TaxID=2898187 RepID=A0ABX7XG18_9FLAO|nr:NAD(P)-binding protein [Faecalibacter bovis]QTV06888.1 NAD(P)-binding protein [Faecalibacter bovis]
MKNGVKSNWSRRDFIKQSALFTIGLTFLNACKKKGNDLFLKLTGTNHILGHRLRFPNFPKPTSEIETSILIIGGGIAGLSAARRLSQKGFNDFLLLELEEKVGGNSTGGENEYSKYPLGAHYLPIPNASNLEILDFLSEEKIIRNSDENNQPIFDEEQLTYAPHERLFIKNYWQDGLIPRYGLDQKEKDEFDLFFKIMNEFTLLKGEDDLYVFDIPMRNSSKQHSYFKLDNLSMEEWLIQEKFTSKNLFIYVNYCCRDDYGTGIKQTSAFAGIHYFAARKHDFKTYDGLVLTWQEGNQRLVNHLSKYAKEKTLNQHLVYQINSKDTHVECLVYDEKSNQSKIIKAKKVINCAPQFVNQYLLPNRKETTKSFHYAPWIIATIVLKRFPIADGVPLAWDNVIHDGNGLGYIYAQHQSLGQFKSPFVITYFHSLEGDDLNQLRRKMYEMNDEDWKKIIIEDLSKAHYTIDKYIESIEIFRRGHGMISPTKGFLFSKEKSELKKNINNQIFFAHSDLSGISIFEEAFYQGLDTADEVMKNI